MERPIFRQFPMTTLIPRTKINIGASPMSFLVCADFYKVEFADIWAISIGDYFTPPPGSLSKPEEFSRVFNYPNKKEYVLLSTFLISTALYSTEAQCPTTTTQ